MIQENQEECIKIIEDRFSEVFNRESITDISYNGNNFYALDNKIGRYKLSIDLTNEEISSMLKQIANYMLQPFSILKPSLDVAFGPYRLSAMHPSFARNNDGKVITFSLRKITPTLKIKEDDFVFAPPEVHYFLKCLMESKLSVLISGKTGSGKTESKDRTRVSRIVGRCFYCLSHQGSLHIHTTQS